VTGRSARPSASSGTTASRRSLPCGDRHFGRLSDRRRGGRIVAVCDQLEQAGGRGLAISAGRGRPGEGAEVVAARQYALTLLATLV